MSCSSCSSASRRSPRGLGGLLLALALAGSGMAHAAWQDDAGVRRVAGEGDVRLLGLRLYHVRLWTDSRPLDPDRPFALEITYYRAVSRERIVEVSLREMQRLAGGTIAAGRLAQWRSQLADALVDVRDGDVLVGAYRPGLGLRFYRGEQPLADIADVDLARAFFGIWLDARTREPALRERLLGATR